MKPKTLSIAILLGLLAAWGRTADAKHPGTIAGERPRGLEHRQALQLALEVIFDEAPGHPHRFAAERVIDVRQCAQVGPGQLG